MLTRVAGAMLALVVVVQPVTAQSPVKIGFVSTFSGPQGQLGEEIHSGFRVALDQLRGQARRRTG